MACVRLIVSDNPSAFVLDRARRLGVESLVFPRSEFSSGGEAVLQALDERQIDYMVLAGFLRLVPPQFIARYEGRIINVHPALLPKFGGKGMYGDRVHEAVHLAVLAGEEHESGITIHHVDACYDHGNVIAQYRVAIAPTDTPADIAGKVHALEYARYPAVIEAEILKL